MTDLTREQIEQHMIEICEVAIGHVIAQGGKREP